jgi:hypothetical protein
MESTETTPSSAGFLDAVLQHPYFVIGVLVAIIVVAILVRLSHSHNESEYKYKPDQE